jgi:phosphatidate phosphatase APP1
MHRDLNNHATTVKVYHGYGHQHNLVIYGHVLWGKPIQRKRYSNSLFTNIKQLARLFFVHPIPNVRVLLQWQNQQLYSTTQKDGFFKFEWQSSNPIEAGWHIIKVHLLDVTNQIINTGEGKLFVPHTTQYGFISDIDDTVLISHSAKTGKKLRLLFTKNPKSRQAFADVVRFYQLLSLAHTTPELLNPFFYVSSSEWNLYNDLNDFFKLNGLPKGIFMLNTIKKWYQLFTTGGTKHNGKLIRVVRILDAFPKQRFVLLGDNTQKDPNIYTAIANKYPDKIVAIYIRNISSKKTVATQQLLASINNTSIVTCLFTHTTEAINHAKTVGLIA